MSEKLLPCPFCGSAFKMGREPNDNHPVAGQFYIYHDYGPLGSLARLCPISINQHFYTEAEALTAWNTRAATQADAAPVADSEDWRKAWRNVALLSSEHEDVRLNEAVAELHSVFEAYAHPPVDNRVSTSSPVDDRGSGNTSGKLRDAVEVWEDAYGSYMLNEVGQDYEAAAAIIEQDREAVRAEQAAEIARLRAAWEAQHKEKVAERAEAKLWFKQAQEAKAELAKVKALIGGMGYAIINAIKETRDAS